MTIDVDQLPPTQYLFLEVMAARHRLGEPYWTFPQRCAAAARALQDAGLVWLRSGPVERHFQAWFTDEGRAAALSATYVPPIERDLAEPAPSSPDTAGEPARGTGSGSAQKDHQGVPQESPAGGNTNTPNE